MRSDCKNDLPCAYDNCQNKQYAKGLCAMHYGRARKEIIMKRGELMSEELKSCPFCGGKVDLWTQSNLGRNFQGWLVKCCQCKISTDVFPDKNMSIHRWNTRPLEAALLVSLTLAKEALDTCNMICAQSDDKDVIHTYDFDESKVEAAVKSISRLQIEEQSK